MKARKESETERRRRQGDGETELKEESYARSRTGSAEWEKKDGERWWQQERGNKEKVYIEEERKIMKRYSDRFA